jgi:hypothetical protein
MGEDESAGDEGAAFTVEGFIGLPDIGVLKNGGTCDAAGLMCVLSLHDWRHKHPGNSVKESLHGRYAPAGLSLANRDLTGQRQVRSSVGPSRMVQHVNNMDSFGIEHPVCHLCDSSV